MAKKKRTWSPLLAGEVGSKINDAAHSALDVFEACGDGALSELSVTELKDLQRELMLASREASQASLSLCSAIESAERRAAIAKLSKESE